MTKPASASGMRHVLTEAVSPPPRRMLTTGSLWEERSADLFKDPRARHIGDTLRVAISIKDKASIDSTSDRSRTATQNGNFDLQYDALLKFWRGSGSASASTQGNSRSTHKGQGATARSETIELSVAAIVTGLLPNGNLMISGTQEIRVNFELRELTVTGIVRPRDIKSDNSVGYDNIAEARISYGGRGRIMEVQQPRWGHQIFDAVAPF